MQTLSEFINMAKKKERTVISWIKVGFVNGASYDSGNLIIHDLARPPYLRASSKNSASIRKGIVIGCKRRLSVNAKIYGISEYEFNLYIDQLVEAGLVERREVDGATFFFSTIKADNMSDNQVYKAIQNFAKTATEAAVGVATEKLLEKR